MLKLLKAIRWTLMIEIVLTQLAIAVVLELFKKEKQKNVTNAFIRSYQKKKYLSKN